MAHFGSQSAIMNYPAFPTKGWDNSLLPVSMM